MKRDMSNLHLTNNLRCAAMFGAGVSAASVLAAVGVVSVSTVGIRTSSGFLAAVPVLWGTSVSRHM